VSATFAQTTRALETDRSRFSVALGLAALVLLGAWATWFSRADVSVREVTSEARIEVSEMAHAIDAPVAGRIVSTRLVLGAAVEAGEVLVEIDAESERRKLAEEETHLATLGPELEALARQLAALQQSLGSDRVTTQAAVEQAHARHEAARVAAEAAEEEARRAERLASTGAISDIERLRARAEAQRLRAAADALALENARLAAAQRTRDDQGRTRAEELRATMASLEGQRSQSRMAAEVLREAIDKRTLRAAISGTVGEIARAHEGEYLKEGDRLGAIVPRGRLRAVADFAPDAAFGRIRVGQSARVRLDGFPWTQYGVVDAIVSSVGSEVRAGKVRVELDLHPAPGSRIPLQHGLPGSIEIDVERTTPALLVFRAAGRALGRPARAAAESGP
jgi:membrane fusion protein (multidrug efflux system)